MKLTTCSGDNHNPSAMDLDQALCALDQPDGFLILAQAPEEYVQFGTGVLEYRDARGHYRATNQAGADEAPDRETLRAVFIDYLSGRPSWKTHVSHWREVSAEVSRSQPRKSWLAVVIVAVVAALIWFLIR